MRARCKHPRVVRVLLDPERLAGYRITVADVRRALVAANASAATGALVAENREILVQTGEYPASGEDVRRLMVGTPGGRPVYVGDVAEVVDGPELPRQYVLFGTGAAAGSRGIGAQGEFPAVTIAVSKKAGENAVDVADALMRRVAELRHSVIPEGVEVTVTRNYGETANDKAQKLIQKLVFATLSLLAHLTAEPQVSHE